MNPTFDPRPANPQRTCTYVLEDKTICGKPFLAQSPGQEVCGDHTIARAWKTAAERRKVRGGNFRDRVFGR